MKIKLLLLGLILFSCQKEGDVEYRYFYKVLIKTPKAIMTYRVNSTGLNKTDTLRNENYKLHTNTFEYAWRSFNPNDKLFVSIKNDTTVGSVKLVVGRSLDTLLVDSTTTNLTFSKK